MRRHSIAAVVLSVMLIAACGDDDDPATATTTAAPTTTAAATTTTERATTTTGRSTTTAARTTTTAARPTTTAAASTTSAASGAPGILTFEVQPDAPCSQDNATVTMAYTTQNVVSISVSINGQEYQGGAGYNPNETSVVAEFPCPPGAPAQATVRLRGCSEDNRCVESDEKTVTVKFE